MPSPSAIIQRILRHRSLAALSHYKPLLDEAIALSPA
jgi:hypothetical protein